MIQLKLAFDFLTTYWKDIAIGIVIAALAYISVTWWNQTIEIGRLKTQITMAAQQNETLQAKVNAYESAEEQSKAAIENADKNRVQIIATLQKEINKIRTQTIPKDCSGAVNYGIQYKDDMKWPERSSQ